MAARTQPASPASRLSLFGFGSLSRATTSNQNHPLERQTSHEEDDDWYIPYNGPVQKPTRQSAAGNRDSWGDILSGWLSEGRGSAVSNAKARDEEDRGQYSRSRAVSNASQFSTSSATRGPQPRTNLQHRPSVPSFIDLDKAGGVGASPTPVERNPQQALQRTPSVNNRASLASIWSFGRKSLHNSPSVEQLRRRVNAPPVPPPPRQRATEPIPGGQRLQQEPIAEDNEYYYSSLLVHSSTRGVPNSQSPFSPASSSANSSPHPYAAARLASEPPRSAPPKGKTRFLDPSKLSITLLDPRGPKVPAYLKPSPRNSVLKASVSTPNLRDIPRGKQRWLSAETWCDALILPRPRFAMRLVEGEPSGRIVSPPGSPISPSEAKFPSRSGSANSSKELKKSRSLGNIFVATTTAPPTQNTKPPIPGPSQLKPNRPKSWALDDLALPSPIPSLAQVVADGERLQAEREKWQSQATHSFQNKRARSVRARSKSVGASQARARKLSLSGAQANTFDFLAERTLLGNQARPPTIHVHGPPIKHQRTSSGGGQTRSSIFSHPTTHAPSKSVTSRTRSHGYSNSISHTISHKSISTDSTAHGYHHQRSQSLGKSALKMAKSTAWGAAALCGLNGAEKSPSINGDERANAFDGALRNNGTTTFRVGEHGNIVVVPTTPSAALAMMSSQPGRTSPTPSGASVSAEGVGLAFSSPEDQPRKYSEPIVMPSHPYANGSSYYKQPIKLTIPEYTAASDRATSPTDSVTPRRQAVTHPYAPLTHPYVAAAMPQGRSPSSPQYLEVKTPNSIYAELTPGHITEFDAAQIQYSPFITTPTEEAPPAHSGKQAVQASAPSGHPYGPSAARYSELGIGEALKHTLRNQRSLDSGLGTSEAEPQGQGPQIEYTSPPVDLQSPETNEQTPATYFDHSPGNVYQRSAEASSQALASSPPAPLDSTPAFRRRGSSGTRLSNQGRSSGSSPGLVSQASSPPLSPRPLPAPGDLDRFRDLFYRPADRGSVTSESPLSRPSLSSRQNSLPLDVSSQASRSVSGLTNLARQLTEDLEELRESHADSSSEHEEDRSSPMWGRRFGGLRGERPEDMEDHDPNVVLSVSSDSDSPLGVGTLPLRLPADIAYTNPLSNFPEDIRMDETESSRASSILDGSNFHDGPSQYLRVGEIEAVVTPPIITTPHRESTRLSVIQDLVDQLEPGQDEEDGLSPLRAISQYSVPSRYSSLVSPLSPNATRASYMTSDTEPSRMSGLSDFPVPPTQTSHFGSAEDSPSSPTSYFMGDRHAEPEMVDELERETEDGHGNEPRDTYSHRRAEHGQTLLREASKDTFGIQHEHDYDNHIGEAF
ncbi:hypothetical protein BXZ70DRAFT_585687 [Cristinia sonorae]|uniref:Uncharacterized protein n=1 Tax=Cristinia sonorae TaxID=1940300 RepID=A0A8K0UFZ6_9AGAR|nr:hypothetical protein BXZ70DRAFT_585687 [Cristinia sonorae]